MFFAKTLASVGWVERSKTHHFSIDTTTILLIIRLRCGGLLYRFTHLTRIPLLHSVFTISKLKPVALAISSSVNLPLASVGCIAARHTQTRVVIHQKKQ
jgi:hypothetical protein